MVTTSWDYNSYKASTALQKILKSDVHKFTQKSYHTQYNLSMALAVRLSVANDNADIR